MEEKGLTVADAIALRGNNGNNNNCNDGKKPCCIL